MFYLHKLDARISDNMQEDWNETVSRACWSVAFTLLARGNAAAHFIVSAYSGPVTMMRESKLSPRSANTASAERNQQLPSMPETMHD